MQRKDGPLVIVVVVVAAQRQKDTRGRIRLALVEARIAHGGVLVRKILYQRGRREEETPTRVIILMGMAVVVVPIMTC